MTTQANGVQRSPQAGVFATLGSTHGWTDLSEPLRAAARDPVSAVLPLLTDLHFVTADED